MRTSWKLTAAAVASVTAMLGTGSPGSASTETDIVRPNAAGSYLYGPVELRNFNSDKCLEIADSYRYNGARAQQWTCVGIATQKWWVDVINPGEVEVVQLINANSGKCLEIADSRLDNGAPAQQWDCVGIPTQQWLSVPTCMECVDPGTRLYNDNSGKVLEIADSYRYNGARAQQWDDAGIRTQIWFYR